MKHAVICPPDHKHAATSTCYRLHLCACASCLQGNRDRAHAAYHGLPYDSVAKSERVVEIGHVTVGDQLIDNQGRRLWVESVRRVFAAYKIILRMPDGKPLTGHIPAETRCVVRRVWEAAA